MTTTADSPRVAASRKRADSSAFRGGDEIAWLKILVPIDFTNCSRKAIQYAEALAQKFGGELALAYVVPVYPIVPDLPSATAEVNQLLRKEAERKLELWKKEIKSTPCRTAVFSGHPAMTIVHEAERMNADLIVLATHSESKVRHALLGSVVERVVRHALCPVLVLREKEHDFLKQKQPKGA